LTIDEAKAICDPRHFKRSGARIGLVFAETAVSFMKLSLLGFLVLLVACDKHSPTEPTGNPTPHLQINCEPVGSEISCVARVTGMDNAVTIQSAWFSSDPTVGTFTAPGRFTPSRRGQVSLWATYDYPGIGTGKVQLTSEPTSVVVDPSGTALVLTYLFGGVLDADTNAALAGVEVRILDGYAQDRSATTNAYGYYRIDGVPFNQIFTITASDAGYQPLTLTYHIAVPNPATLEFRLHRLP
jgi:Carboxypeptidase regulatory-like domain